MEGSSYIREVEDYDVLAAYYDELLGDEDAYSLWMKYIEEEPFRSVLELATGSGTMARILKSKGYDVKASDLSPAMKEVAKKKGFDGEYLVMNMIDFSLDEKFDLILCLCDSFNYLEKEELLPFFITVSKHLKADGRLLFDMHHMNRICEFADEYIEEGELEDGCGYQWTILADCFQNKLHENFIFYTNEGIIKEHHQQSVFNIEDVDEAAKKAGLKLRWVRDFVPDEKVLAMGGHL